MDIIYETFPQKLLKMEVYPHGQNGTDPTLTDSGGFQVMSLGSGCGKVVSMKREDNMKNTEEEKRLAHVTEYGVHFHDPFTGQ